MRAPRPIVTRHGVGFDWGDFYAGVARGNTQQDVTICKHGVTESAPCPARYPLTAQASHTLPGYAGPRRCYSVLWGTWNATVSWGARSPVGECRR